MKDGELIDLLNRVNTRLKTDKVRVTIKPKGNRLYLRGTFPSRPGSNNTKPHQQEIAIGLYVTVEGLHRAEKEARKVGELLKFQPTGICQPTSAPFESIRSLEEGRRQRTLASLTFSCLLSRTFRSSCCDRTVEDYPNSHWRRITRELEAIASSIW